MLRKTTDATSAIARKPYKFLTKSHRTLLMLRRVKYDTCSLDSKFGENQKPLSGVTPIDNKDRLELRHQRTGDVVFDWADDNDSTKTPQYYIYKMIETLLPKAMNKVTQAEIQDKQFERARKFKLVELWATDKSPRKGWLKVCQQKE